MAQQLPSPSSKYPFVGPRFQGEVNGYIYHPWTDAYYADPKAQRDWGLQSGAIEEEKVQKAPGLFQQIAPIAAGAGATAFGEALIKDPSKLAGDIFKLPGQAVSGIKDVLGFGTNAPAGQATVPGTNLAAAIPSTQAAPVLGSTALGPQPASTGLTSGLPSLGTALGAAGVGLGTYAAYQGIKNQNPLAAGLGGAGVAGGLTSLGYSLGPVGIAASIAAPALIALGSSYLDKDEWKTEKKKLNKLEKQGAYVPPELLASMPTRGRSKEELIRGDLGADFVGFDRQGQWVNNKFAQSRNEADLRPEDVVNFAAFAEQDKDWFRKPLAERLQKAQAALAAGAVKEAKGSLKIDFSKIK